MQSINKQFNPSPAEITNYFGDCISLFPIDKQFNDISIGLYLKDSNYTIWSFSHLPKTKIRIQSICQQFENLLGLKLAENSHNQLFFECGDNHTKPLKFLFAQVVAKPPDFKFNDQNLQIKDSKSEFLITVLKIDEGYQVKLNSDGNVMFNYEWIKPINLLNALKNYETYDDKHILCSIINHLTHNIFPCLNS